MSPFFNPKTARQHLIFESNLAGKSMTKTKSRQAKNTLFWLVAVWNLHFPTNSTSISFSLQPFLFKRNSSIVSNFLPGSDFLIICVIAVNNMFPKAKRFQDTGKTGKYKNRAGLLHYHVSVSTTYGRQLWNWLEKMQFTFNPASIEEFSTLSWDLFPVFLFNCSTLLHSPYVSILLRMKWISFAFQESSHNFQFFVESLLHPTLLLRKEFSNCQTSVYKILVPIILIIVYPASRGLSIF